MTYQDLTWWLYSDLDDTIDLSDTNLHEEDITNGH